MDFLKIFLIFGCVPCIFASKCSNISGIWLNELGSTMVLKADESGHISGEYWTAVQSETGTASVVSKLSGVYSNQNGGSQLAFSVLFNHGASLATWVGQCSACEKEEVLYTTYILHSFPSDPNRKWESVTINQNTFRKHAQDMLNVEYPVLSELAESKPHTDLNVVGVWKSSGNEELEILGKSDAYGDLLFKGKWKSDDSAEYEVRGIGDFSEGTWPLRIRDENLKITAVAMMTLRDGLSRSWTGYVSSVPHVSVNALETAWLEHEYAPSCLNPRGIVRFGMTNFNKTTISGDGPLKKSETFFDKLRNFFTSIF